MVKNSNQKKEDAASGGRIKKFLTDNWGSLLFLFLMLGYIAYQRLPLYIADQQYLGKPAPDFQVRTADGQMVRLSDLRGKKVLINFWATWCVPCRVELPLLVSMYDELKDKDFELLAVASEDEATVRRFLAENPVNYPVLLDDTGEIAAAYDVAVYPSFVFIDENGLTESRDHGMNLLLRWKIRWKVTGSPF